MQRNADILQIVAGTLAGAYDCAFDIGDDGDAYCIYRVSKIMAAALDNAGDKESAALFRKLTASPKGRSIPEGDTNGLLQRTSH